MCVCLFCLASAPALLLYANAAKGPYHMRVERTYLKATIISGYKFWWFRGFAGINFSDFELKYLSSMVAEKGQVEAAGRHQSRSASRAAFYKAAWPHFRSNREKYCNSSVRLLEIKAHVYVEMADLDSILLAILRVHYCWR